MAEPTALPATALAERIAARELSARETVEAHLRRIEEVDEAINAVVALDAEAALAQASERDAELARGVTRGPLHGVPFTVKDNIAATGLAMAIGVPERARTIPAADATAVARLKAAGAILLGKTNCPPWGGGIETDNELYGRTSNPYDLSRTPGGSSGAKRRSSPRRDRRSGWAPTLAPASGCRPISAASPASNPPRTGFP